MGVVRPVPRQRAQGMRPSGPSTLPVPEQAGQRHLRWPFQHAPQEILPVPSQCSQWAMVPPRVVAAVAAETARPAVWRAPLEHTRKWRKSHRGQRHGQRAQRLVSIHYTPD